MESGRTIPSSAWESSSRSRRFARTRGTRVLAALACALLLAPLAWGQTPTALADRGDYPAAWEKASQVQTAAMQTTAARAATDEVAYHLARVGAPLSEELIWLNRAVTAAETATKLDPDSAAAILQLVRAKGEIARRSGILQNLNVAPELKTLFDRALALDPNEPDALAGLAMWHLELVKHGVGWLYGGRKEAVIPLLEKSVTLAPEQINLRLEYATALIALGKPDGARAQLEVALTLPTRRASDDLDKEKAADMLKGLASDR